MSRSMLFTACTPASYSLVTLRQDTSAMVAPFPWLDFMVGFHPGHQSLC
jgi:hypothetical protein